VSNGNCSSNGLSLAGVASGGLLRMQTEQEKHATEIITISECGKGCTNEGKGCSKPLTCSAKGPVQYAGCSGRSAGEHGATMLLAQLRPPPHQPLFGVC
jgi:hypothetical protein